MEVFNGTEVTREQLGTGKFPAIKCGDITSDSLNLHFDKCVSFVNKNLIKRQKYFEYGDLLIANFSDIQKTGKACAYLGKEKCLAGLGVTVARHNQNSKFIAYAWSTNFIRQQIMNSVDIGTVVNFWSQKAKKIQIPIPPIETQKEIADILDKFYILEQELERELENRKKQYEYYKNLIFERGINELNWELKSLGEVATKFTTGQGVTREQLGTGSYPAIKAGDVNSILPEKFYKCTSFVNPLLIKKIKYFHTNDILISGLGSEKTIGKACAYLGEDSGILGECVISLSHQQNPKYLSYVLSSDLSRKQFQSASTTINLKRLHASHIKKIKIPLPSLEEQERVVKMLDKLFVIINDIKEGIPALIQKNRDQYNFYKESLISPE